MKQPLTNAGGRHRSKARQHLEGTFMQSQINPGQRASTRRALLREGLPLPDVVLSVSITSASVCSRAAFSWQQCCRSREKESTNLGEPALLLLGALKSPQPSEPFTPPAAYGSRRKVRGRNAFSTFHSVNVSQRQRCTAHTIGHPLSPTTSPLIHIRAMSTVALTGATGNLGVHLARGLIGHKELQVKVLTRAATLSSNEGPAGRVLGGGWPMQGVHLQVTLKARP